MWTLEDEVTDSHSDQDDTLDPGDSWAQSKEYAGS